MLLPGQCPRHRAHGKGLIGMLSRNDHLDLNPNSSIRIRDDE